ncbi:MAG: DNA integrity scanning protein DisA nucleotide-binding domain protein, partial [Acidimicrobiales bacterium]
VHDLGSRRIGATLVYRTGAGTGRFESPWPTPPPLNMKQPVNLAPMQHVLSQSDGATVFDEEGTLVGLGVRLVPSRTAEETVAPTGGTRHTSARRFSSDEPESVVIVVSEDGPVTVFRRGEMLGRSAEDSSGIVSR